MSCPSQFWVRRPQEHSDDVRPPARLGDGLQTELAIEDVQIALCGNDEHAVWPDVQSFGDQFHGHLSYSRKYFVEPRFNNSEMIDDHYSDAHVGR